MSYGKKYKKKRFFKKKGYKKTYIPRSIPTVLKSKHTLREVINSYEFTNLATLHNPFAISFYPFDIRPFNLNPILPAYCWSDQAGGTASYNNMGFDKLSVYAVKVKITMVPMWDTTAIAAPLEWIVASKIHDQSATTAGYSQLNVYDVRRQFNENGIYTGTVTGLTTTSMPNAYHFKKYITHYDALGKRPPDDAYVTYQSSYMFTDNPILTMGLVCLSQLNGNTTTNTNANLARFRLYYKLTQYINWKRTEIIPVVT